MNRYLAIALATTALVVAAPSFAQNSSDQLVNGLRAILGNQHDPAERDLNDQERRLTDMVERSANERRIDHEQADRAFNELRTIHGEQDDLRNRHGGRLTPQDHQYLSDKLARLDHEIDHMQGGGEHVVVEPGAGFQQGRGDFWERAPRDLDQREDWLDQRIHTGMADGSLDHREADNAIHQLRFIRHDEAEFARQDGGLLSGEHRTELAARLDELGRQLHHDRAN